jgi:hypothetical protein
MRNMIGLAVVVMVTASGIARADDNVPVDKLPKAVVDTLKKRFPKGELTKASKSGEGDKTTYEVSVKEGTLKADVDLTAAGAITGMEKQIAEADLPKVIAAAVKAKQPKGTVKTCEEVIAVKDGKEELEYYEVVVETPDKKTVELEIEKDGKVRKENAK